MWFHWYIYIYTHVYILWVWMDAGCFDKGILLATLDWRSTSLVSIWFNQHLRFQEIQSPLAPGDLFFMFFSYFFVYIIYISNSLFFLHHDSVAISFRFPKIRGDLSELLRGLWLREVLFCHRCLCRVDQNSLDVIDVGGQLTWICFRRFRNLLPKSSEIPKNFKSTKSILQRFTFCFFLVCFKSILHVLHVLHASRVSRFLGVFVCDLFSLPGHKHLFGAALQRDGGTQTDQTTKRPKTSLSRNFQYLPVISSQKWSCRCCKQPKSSPPFPIPVLPFDLNATYATWSWNQIMTGQENTREYKRSNLEVSSSYVLSFCFLLGRWPMAREQTKHFWGIAIPCPNGRVLGAMSAILLHFSLFVILCPFVILSRFHQTSLSVVSSHSSRHREFSEESFCL